MTENGSQIVSEEFIQFATDWEFKHVTSSLRYPKSNSQSESVVCVVKNVSKKALNDGWDPWSALVIYWTGPQKRWIFQSCLETDVS